MSDGWGEADGIKSNYEDDEDEPENDVESTQEPSPTVSTEPEAPSTPSTCQAETRNETQCQNDAVKNGEYCKKHTPNTAGEFTWKFERVQMYMLPDTKNDVFNLKARIEMDSDTLEINDVSKKEYEQTIMELITEDEAVQERLAERLNEKYSE